MSVEGRKAARARAQWSLGDPSWADIIIRAYLNPKESEEELAIEKENYKS